MFYRNISHFQYYLLYLKFTTYLSKQGMRITPLVNLLAPMYNAHPPVSEIHDDPADNFW